jgi:threonine dehydrogenase-like Zn-dependent dehydrogenase
VSLVAENHANEFRLSDLSGEKSIKISANNLYGEFLEAIRIMDSGLFDFDKMITHTYAIDDVLDAFEIMKNKDRQPTQKVVILPWE